MYAQCHVTSQKNKTKKKRKRAGVPCNRIRKKDQRHTK